MVVLTVRVTQEAQLLIEEEKRLEDPTKWLADLYTRRQEVIDRIEKRRKAQEVGKSSGSRRTKQQQERLRLMNLHAMGSDVDESFVRWLRHESSCECGTRGSPPRGAPRYCRERTTRTGTFTSRWRVKTSSSRRKRRMRRHSRRLTSCCNSTMPTTCEPMPRHRSRPSTSCTLRTSSSLLLASWQFRFWVTLTNQPTNQPTIDGECSTERCRAPEVLFQPSMLGMSQAGVIETSDFVLHTYKEPERLAMTQDVFLTGGSCFLPGFSARIESELRSLRPFDAPLRVRLASNPSLDAWRGAAKWIQLYPQEFQAALVSKAEYDEHGAAFFKTHRWSNYYFQPEALE